MRTEDSPAIEFDELVTDAFRYDRVPTPPLAPATLEWLLLCQEIQDFGAFEADLLDQWRYREWLDLLTEDVRYWMPIRRNVEYGEWGAERTSQLQDLCWFDENKETLTARVDQLETGVHWVEEPRSRVCHLITNIRIAAASPSVEDAQSVVVRSRFLLYGNHLESEETLLIGKRRDVLRRSMTPVERDRSPWQIASRAIILDQNVLLAQSLSVLM